MNKTKIIAAFAEKAGITKTDAARYFDTMNRFNGGQHGGW